MPSTPECICRQDELFVDENRWFLNPDPLGCPKHRPTKRYCKFHHNGFYGNCSACARYDSKQIQKTIVALLSDLLEEQVESRKALNSILYQAVQIRKNTNVQGIPSDSGEA